MGDQRCLPGEDGLDYGPVGRGPIPGNATLLFRIELLEIAGR